MVVEVWVTILLKSQGMVADLTNTPKDQIIAQLKNQAKEVDLENTITILAVGLESIIKVMEVAVQKNTIMEVAAQE